ncbi:MAG: hypothetical protein JXA93_04780, partial [Anaerolineae bacterium]|nr:hypothetical protein [Anaerolineae bacterium]
CRDWSGKLTFTDVGAIVYYLKAIPWLVPGFSVDTHLESLLALHERLEQGERLMFAAKKYLIEARKAETLSAWSPVSGRSATAHASLKEPAQPRRPETGLRPLEKLSLRASAASEATPTYDQVGDCFGRERLRPTRKLSCR